MKKEIQKYLQDPDAHEKLPYCDKLSILARAVRFFCWLSMRTRTMWIVYPIGAWGLTQLCRQSLFQRLFWKREVAIISEFLTQTSIGEKHDLQVVIQHGLMIKIWWHWWEEVLGKCYLTQFRQLVSVSGASQFINIYQKREGILLLFYHSECRRLFQKYLNHCYFGRGVSIGRINELLRKKGQGENKFEKLLEKTRQYKRAKNELEAGGIVQILPDGMQGSRGIPKDFHARKYNFQTGFAELALDTGAHLIPVDVYSTMKGQLQIDYLKPLDKGSAKMNRQQRIEIVVDQYVDYLHKCWQKQPWNTPVHTMEKHLNLPLVNPISGSGKNAKC